MLKIILLFAANGSGFADLFIIFQDAYVRGIYES